MAKLYPTHQTSVDLRDGNTVGVFKVKLTADQSASFDHVHIDQADDVAFLHTSRTTSDPSFYLTQGILNIESGTAGAEHLIVTRHTTGVNYRAGGS